MKQRRSRGMPNATSLFIVSDERQIPIAAVANCRRSCVTLAAVSICVIIRVSIELGNSLYPA